MQTMSVTGSRLYRVVGMTCEHCVMSVTEELSEIEGVEAVKVELDTGRVAVSGAGFADEQIAKAVRAAGYEVA